MRGKPRLILKDGISLETAILLLVSTVASQVSGAMVFRHVKDVSVEQRFLNSQEQTVAISRITVLKIVGL